MVKMKTQSQGFQNFIWNSIASVANAALSVLLLVVVTRVVGAEVAGLFALAFALAQQFQVVGAYEVRTFHATDIAESYSFANYFTARLITVFAMMLLALAYALMSEGISYDALVIVSVCLLRAVDALEDVFHGMLQQQGRLDLASKALALRCLATMLSFALALILTHNLVLTSLISFVCSFVVMLISSLPFVKRFKSISLSKDLASLAHLLWTCFPLFAGSFLLMCIINLPRLAIESKLDKLAQTHYAIIFMPVSVVALLSGFVFKPLLSNLAQSWLDQDLAAFKKLSVQGPLYILAFGALLALIGAVIGPYVLSFIYGTNIEAYAFALGLILFGGAFNAVSILEYYALVSMRLQWLVVAGYAAGALACFILAPLLVGAWGLLGAALAYSLSMLFTVLVFALGIFFGLVKAQH